MTPYDASDAALPRTIDTNRPSPEGVSKELPAYMLDVYDWAYLNPRNVGFLDREAIVSLILWGNSHRLKQALLDEIDPAASVLQAAHVYGDLIPEIAKHLTQPEQLEIVEIAPVQAAQCREKLRDYPQAVVRISDVATLNTTPRDVVSCFFLLHEIPTDYKHAVVDTLLDHVAEGGKAVFIDYHRPHWLHPLRPLMMAIFHLLEPFAGALLDNGVASYANNAKAFTWRTETYFGGLYQKTVAERR